MVASALPAIQSFANSQGAAGAVTCAHCGNVVPPSAAVTDAEAPQFCCHGCAVVYQAISEHGLGRYYELSENRAPARTSNSRYEEYDDAVFREHHVELDANGAASVALYLEDLRCAGCMWLVESTPYCMPGVSAVSVDFARSCARVQFDPDQVQLSRIAAHIDSLGHPVHPYRGFDRETERRREDRAMLIKIGVAGAAVGNVMLLAAALYSGMLDKMAGRDATFFRWASMLVAVPTLSFAAMPFFRAALASLRSKRLHLDLPLSIGIVAGLFWGSVNVVRGKGEIYFDSLAMLVFLLLLSRWLVGRQQRKAMLAGELLFALAPAKAHKVVLPAGEASTDTDYAALARTDVPMEAVLVGDVVVVLPGEVFPVDGTIVHGATRVDTSVLTGESEPRTLTVAATVAAGTANIDAPVWVRAAAVGEATRLGKLARYVDEVSHRKAPIERMVDALAGRFVVVVLAVGAVTFLAWTLRTSWDLGMEQTMALLVVTCPCALALATPLAVAIGLGRAAKLGILVKGADALERLATPGKLFLDKTGTITEGRSEVAIWHGAATYKPMVAAVERMSMHPLARAIARSLSTQIEGVRDLSTPADAPTLTAHPSSAAAMVASDIVEEFGCGIRGTVAGQRLQIGAPQWVCNEADASSAAFDQAALAAALAQVRATSATPVVVAADGIVVAVMGLRDALRPETARIVASLQKIGWEVALLSGDEPAAVQAAARAIGVTHAIAGATPEQKLALVTESAAVRATVFVGDGVNDAAALAAATCGIAVSGSAEASMEAADVFLSKPGIGAVATTLRGAVTTIATIKRNFRVSLFYNVVAGGLAVTGLIHPLLAALMMPLSSSSVLLSSWWSRSFKE